MRSRLPVVETLEPRYVLSAGMVPPGNIVFHQGLYPYGTVGPLPYGAHMAASAAAYPAAAYQDDQPPYGGLSSSASTSIGAAFIGDVYPGGASAIADSDWTIVGGAVASQVWNTSTARVAYTAGQDHNYESNGATSDTWNWNWDENPGTKTVTDTVTYTDGTVWTASRSYTVVAPTATLTLNVPQASEVGPGANPLGFFNAVVTDQGTITMGTINGATGGFVQTINMQDQEDYAKSNAYPNGVSHGMKFPANLYALDVPKASGSPYFSTPLPGA